MRNKTVFVLTLFFLLISSIAVATVPAQKKFLKTPPANKASKVKEKEKKTKKVVIYQPDEVVSKPDSLIFALDGGAPFLSNPFYLEVPVGSRLEIITQARGAAKQRVVIKEAELDATGEFYVNITSLVAYDDANMRPWSPRRRFTTTKPVVLYEIQEETPGVGFRALDLSQVERYRTPQGATTIVEQPIRQGALNEPVITFRWGALETIRGQFSREQTLTIFNKAVFDILLRGTQSKSSDVILDKIREKRNTSVFEDIDKTETRSLSFRLGRNGCGFRYQWWIEDLFKQVPPFGGCDCLVRLDLDVYWGATRGGGFNVTAGDIYPNDLYVNCPACPLHTLIFAYAQTIATFRNIFRDDIKAPSIQLLDLSAEMKREFQTNLTNFINSRPFVLPPDAALVGEVRYKVLDAWSEDGAFKLKFRYVVEYRID